MAMPVKQPTLYPVNSDTGAVVKDIQDNYYAGYIKLYRSIKSNWLWKESRVKTPFEAWVDLLLRASHDDQKEPIGVDFIVVKRGQVLTSQLQLSKEWFWSRKKVTHFLSSLQKDNMITVQTTTKWSMITLCNYASYQDRRTTTEQQRNNNGTTTEHIQELKEYKEDNSTPPKIWLYSHNGFFDRQIARNSKAPEIESYKRLVEYLHGKNPDELRFDNVLSISKQISYKDFVSLKETARATGRTIKEVLTAMENTAGLKKKYKNVYLTAKNWLQMEFKK